MSSVLSAKRLSFEEFVALESSLESRQELLNGEALAMVGGTAAHNRIALNIAFTIRSQASGNCPLFVNDMKLRIDGNAFYPNVMATCQNVPADATFIEHPCMIAEISSPSTANYDSTVKSRFYRRIKSLETYLIVAVNTRAVNVYQRVNDLWAFQSYLPGERIPIPCLTLELEVDAIYANLNLPSVEASLSANALDESKR